MWKSDFSSVIINELPEWYELFKTNKRVNDPLLQMRLEKSQDLTNHFNIAFINPNIIRDDIESEIAEDIIPITEGNIKYYYGKKYERKPENRRKAIEIHGLKCKVCGFDFEKVYGNRGRGFIEIHHCKPLSTLGGEQVINPYTDLVPVCSNCHRMIHRRKDKVLSLDEMQDIVKCSK